MSVIPNKRNHVNLSLNLSFMISSRLLIILTILAFVSIVLQVSFAKDNDERRFAWIDGAAIIAAVVIVIAVSSGNDWAKERQFRQLNKKLERSEPATVIR